MGGAKTEPVNPVNPGFWRLMMAHFVETTSGVLVNMADVDRIYREENGGCRLRIRGSERSEFISYYDASDLTRMMSAQYVAALPGYFVVSGNLEPEDTFEQFCRWQAPVIAWQFSPAFDYPSPVTVDGAWDGNSDSGDMLIVQPNGYVVSIGNQGWQSLEAAFADLKKDAG
jgi:hypothetical protein